MSVTSSNIEVLEKPKGLWGVATPTSPGKDTPTGHWELLGAPLPWKWKYFKNKQLSFSSEIIDLIQELSGSSGILGNCHASGTEIIEKFKKKEFFQSELLTKDDQLILMKNIKIISSYKGIKKDKDINVSDIAFIEKN